MNKYTIKKHYKKNMKKHLYEKPETLVFVVEKTEFICLSTDGAGEHNPGKDEGGEGEMPGSPTAKDFTFGYEDYEDMFKFE